MVYLPLTVTKDCVEILRGSPSNKGTHKQRLRTGNKNCSHLRGNIQARASSGSEKGVWPVQEATGLELPKRRLDEEAPSTEEL